ncbi:MAG: TetR/AcrR family transcriptional regulator [Anaerolinea sp.]|nr:TetR/AcrR family transcriptional regulator [Anaerolinea sp.]
MSQQGRNLRVRRTQKLLRDALVDLIEERGFEELTVGEITERAMISRAAFYRNYQDKYALVEQIFAEAMQALFNALAAPATEHPPELWVRFFEHIADYERLYRALLGRKGSPWFVQKMRVTLIDLLKQYQRLAAGHAAPKPDGSTEGDDFVPTLLAAMLVEAITWWLEHQRPYAPDVIANRCVALATAIFTETGTWR